MDDNDEKPLSGITFVETKDGGIEMVELEPHYQRDCARVCEEAQQRALGHETVFEAPDTHSMRASVGYSKSYAANYDAVFGKN